MNTQGLDPRQYSSLGKPQGRSNRLCRVQTRHIKLLATAEKDGSGHEAPCSLNFDRTALRAAYNFSLQAEQHNSNTAAQSKKAETKPSSQGF